MMMMLFSLFSATLFALVGGVFSSSASATSSAASSAASPAAYLPLSLTLEDLEGGTRNEELIQALQKNGIISIVGGYRSEKELALDEFCQCQAAHRDDFTRLIPSTQEIALEDGMTKRTTLASATVGDDMPLALDEKVEAICGSPAAEAMEDLRDSVSAVSQAFIKAIDQIALPSQSPILHDIYGQPYSSMSSIIKSATHLEHFHIYEKAAVSTAHGNHQDTLQGSHQDTKTLDFHTDAGLFLVFVPGYNCQGDNRSDSNSFWIRDAEGQALPVKFSHDTQAVVMLGAGAERWLKTSIPLKATQHAVTMQPGQRRAWYGKMHLVPESAIVQTVPTTVTFEELKQSVTTTSIQLATGRQDDKTIKRLVSPSLGCGDVYSEKSSAEEVFPILSMERRHRRIQHVGAPSDCNNVTNFFCWYQCLDIPDAQSIEGYVNEGYSLYCLDPSVLASSGNKVSEATAPCKDGYTHNGKCQGSWQPTAPGVKTTANFDYLKANQTVTLDQYCYGGVSMYMDGFHWVHDSLCVVYLFPGWVLSSRGKLAGAAIGTLVMGIILEGIIWQRRHLLKTMAAGKARLGFGSVMYGAQLTLGYFLMLVIMTYSGVLFCCSVAGLVIGNVLFNAKDGFLGLRSEEKKEEKLNEGLLHPCVCADDKTTGAAADPCNESSSDDARDIADGATPCCQHSA